jgi:hypothetical protein
MPNGNVNFTITDGALGAIDAPSTSIQCKIGTAAAGTAFQIVSASGLGGIATLQSTYVAGPLLEAAALVCQGGGTVLTMLVPTTTASIVKGSNVATTSVTAATTATPIVITSASHGLKTGDVATIASVGGNTPANGTFVVTVISSSQFSLNGSVGSGSYTSGGTVQPTGVHTVQTGTSVTTVTGTPNDRADVWMKVITGGTVGTAGIVVQFSLDAGRSYGNNTALGTNTTFAMTSFGVTVHFAAGTFVAGDLVKFQTTIPLPSATDVTTAINAFNSAQDEWGCGMHIIGDTTGTNAATYESDLDALFTAGRYTFAFLEARDFDAAIDASEAAWMTSIEGDYASLSAKRICAGAGHYNIQSPIVTTFAGAPQYRRPLTWVVCKRAVQVPLQVLYSRVRDGSLPATTGPGTQALIGDGFIYHDERLNSGLGAARFMAARTRIGKGNGGVFVDQPYLMSPSGSTFDLVPKRQVIDAACSVCRPVLELYINDTVRLQPLTSSNPGQIVPQDATEIENAGDVVLQTNLIGVGAVSDANLAINRTTNIAVSETLTGTVSVEALGYVLEIDISIGFVNPAFATG